jgi:amino acid transporter
MTGYVHTFLQVPDALLIPMVVLALAAIAVWGIEQSAWVAGMISVIEVGGLVWIILLSLSSTDLAAVDWMAFRPHGGAVLPVLAGAVLSFYAYIGFEDMVEVAEEVRDVRRTLPRAILATLVLTSLIYVLLLVAVLVAVGPEVLAGAAAPLVVVHGALTDGGGRLLGVIALLAIVNGALIQIVMASRVVYGLASRGQLPAVFAYVEPRLRTPVVATLAVAGAILVLALLGHLSGLAETTSVLMLTVFALANLSLWRLKGRSTAPAGVWQVPRPLPLLGFVVCTWFVGHAISGWFS